MSAWIGSREPLHGKMGDWVYGCDACQNACPYNRRAWEETEDFPGLAELAACQDEMEPVRKMGVGADKTGQIVYLLL